MPTAAQETAPSKSEGAVGAGDSFSEPHGFSPGTSSFPELPDESLCAASRPSDTQQAKQVASAGARAVVGKGLRGARARLHTGDRHGTYEKGVLRSKSVWACFLYACALAGVGFLDTQGAAATAWFAGVFGGIVALALVTLLLARLEGRSVLRLRKPLMQKQRREEPAASSSAATSAPATNPTEDR